MSPAPVVTNDLDELAEKTEDLSAKSGLSWPLAAIAIAAAVTIAWSGAVRNGFVWDDEWLMPLVENPTISHALQILGQGTFQPLEQGGGAYYRPAVMASYIADSFLWTRKPWGYHTTNLLLHFAVALLLWLTATRLLTARPARRATPGAGPRSLMTSSVAALVVALLFAVHPVHAGSVVYISGRSDILATLFSLCAVYFFLKDHAAREEPPGLHGTGAASGSGISHSAFSRSFLATVLFSALALLTKESALVLPAILIVWDFLLDSAPDSPARAGLARAARNPRAGRAIRWGVLGGMIGAMALLRTFMLHTLVGARPVPLGTGQVLLTIPAAFLYSIEQMFWPGFSNRYVADIVPVGSLGDTRFLLGLTTAGAVVALASLIGRREPRSHGPIAACAIGLLSAIALVPVLAANESPFPASEHFLYFPAAMIAIVLAFPMRALFERAVASGQTLRLAAISIFVAIPFVSWSWCAIVRTPEWRDPVRLFSVLAESEPGSSTMRYNLGVSYQREGRIAEAIRAYEDALRLSPSNSVASNNLGALYERAGRNADAERAYRAALPGDSNQKVITFNLAHLLHREGRLEEAIAGYQEVILANPTFVEAHLSLGDALAERGDSQGALMSYREAARVGPDNGRARARYGSSLVLSGHPGEGLAELREGLRLAPGDDRVRNDIAAVLLSSNDPENAKEAIPLLDESLARWPKDAKAHYNKGTALRFLGQKNEAAAEFTTSVQLSPAYAKALNSLGVTLFELGRAPEALSCFDKLVQVEPRNARNWNNRAIILKAMGRTAEAKSAFRQALALDPTFPDPAKHLSELGEAPGRMPGARPAPSASATSSSSG